jgi:hypothetical protein
MRAQWCCRVITPTPLFLLSLMPATASQYPKVSPSGRVGFIAHFKHESLTRFISFIFGRLSQMLGLHHEAHDLPFLLTLAVFIIKQDNDFSGDPQRSAFPPPALVRDRVTVDSSRPYTNSSAGYLLVLQQPPSVASGPSIPPQQRVLLPYRTGRLLDLGLALKVLAGHQVGDLVVVGLLVTLLLLHALVGLGQLTQGGQGVGAELIQDAGDEFGELLVLTVAVDGECVGGDGSVHCLKGVWVSIIPAYAAADDTIVFLSQIALRSTER